MSWEVSWEVSWDLYINIWLAKPRAVQPGWGRQRSSASQCSASDRCGRVSPTRGVGSHLVSRSSALGDVATRDGLTAAEPARRQRAKGPEAAPAPERAPTPVGKHAKDWKKLGTFGRTVAAVQHPIQRVAEDIQAAIDRAAEQKRADVSPAPLAARSHLCLCTLLCHRGRAKFLRQLFCAWHLRSPS